MELSIHSQGNGDSQDKAGKVFAAQKEKGTRDNICKGLFSSP